MSKDSEPRRLFRIPPHGRIAGELVLIAATTIAGGAKLNSVYHHADLSQSDNDHHLAIQRYKLPKTGTGGYLVKNDNTSFPVGILAALGVSSAVLVAGGFAKRRPGAGSEHRKPVRKRELKEKEQ